MSTVTVNAFKARTGTTKAGKPYFQQTLEVPQADRPAAQFTRFCNDEAHVLAPGKYTAKLGLYQKTFDLKDGKRAYELVASLYDFTPVK